MVGAAVDGDVVFFASLDNIVRAVNRGNGNQRWSKPPSTRPVLRRARSSARRRRRVCRRLFTFFAKPETAVSMGAHRRQPATAGAAAGRRRT